MSSARLRFCTKKIGQQLSDALRENKTLKDRLRWKDKELHAYEDQTRRTGQQLLEQQAELVRLRNLVKD